MRAFLPGALYMRHRNDDSGDILRVLDVISYGSVIPALKPLIFYRLSLVVENQGPEQHILSEVSTSHAKLKKY